MTEKKLHGRIIDLTGQRFGRLMVSELDSVREFPNRRTGSFWKCDCGNEIVTRSANLRRGGTKSCGCLHIGKPNARKEKGESGFNRVFMRYKRNAEKRDISFYLSREDFKHYTSSNCHYCGEEPKMISIGSKRTKECTEHSQYIYNGIDRINSDLQYSIDNCTSACASCNRAKMEMSYDEFIEWRKRLCNHLKLTEQSDQEKEEMNIMLECAEY